LHLNNSSILRCEELVGVTHRRWWG